MKIEFVNWNIDQKKSLIQHEEKKDERYRKKGKGA